MKFTCICFLFILLIWCWNETEGQVLGPELEAGSLEIGCIRKWFHRKLEPHFLSGADWGCTSVFIKYGVNQWLKLSAEGAVYNLKSKRSPDGEYRTYVLGAGIVSPILRYKHFRIALAFHYSESFYFQRSPSRYHSNTRSIVSTVQVERTFTVYRQNVTVWVAPGYVSDEIIQYAGRPYYISEEITYYREKMYRNKSLNNFGLAMGTNFLLFGHIEPFFHVVYADFFQPRVGIGYQF